MHACVERTIPAVEELLRPVVVGRETHDCCQPTPGTAVRAEFRGIWTAGGSAARDRLAVENMDLWRPTATRRPYPHFSLILWPVTMVRILAIK